MLPLKQINGWAILALFAVMPTITHALPSVKGEQKPPAVEATPFTTALTNAHAAVLRNDLEAATTEFAAAAKLDEKSPLPHIGMAEVARRQNKPDRAEFWLKKAVAVAPKSADAQRAWARYLVGQHKYQEAEASLNKAAPPSADVYVDLGGIYLSGLKKPKEAVRAYREALKLNANHAGAHVGLGSALAIQGEMAAAVAEFELAAKLAPQNAVPLHELGRLYASEKKFDQALAVMDKALQVEPGYMPARLDRGDIFVATGSLDRALAEYQAAAKALPGLAIAHLKVGAVYQAQKKWADAELAFLKAVEADPKMFAAYNNLAWMAAERKENLQNALVWAKKAVEIAPEVGDSLDTLAWVYRARGELDEAVLTLEKLVAKQPQRAGFVYHLGVVYSEKGQRKEAVAAFGKALAISKDFPGADDARRRLETLGGK